MKVQHRAASLVLCFLAAILFASTTYAADVDKALLESGRRATAFVYSEFPKVAGSGTAFCIDSSGVFITCSHVVTHDGKVGKIKITLNPGTRSERTIPATVASSNADMDVAILRVERQAMLHTVDMASPAHLDQIAETSDVLALGYPFGNNLAFGRALPEVSFSPGRITALRHTQGMLALIQFDGSINPGNSGGPLLDGKGNVIGIVQAIIPGKNINFAIPATAAWILLNRAGIVLTPRILTDPEEAERLVRSMEVHAANRLPLPNDAALATARKLVKEVFSAQFADKSPTGRATLGSEILKRALHTKDDPASRYAMLIEARDAAAAGNDQSTAYYAAATLCDEFDVKSLELMKDIIVRLAPHQTKPQDAAIAAATGLLVVEAMVPQQDFDGQKILIPIVRASAAGSQNPTVIAQVRERLARLQTQAAAHDAAMAALEKLKTAPADPAANLAVGRYDCFTLGDWDKGLPYLAKGSDPEIKALAVQELSKPTKPEDVISLGDGWWDFGSKQTDATHDPVLRHASAIYSTVLTSTNGLRREILEKRVGQFPTNPLENHSETRPAPDTASAVEVRVEATRSSERPFPTQVRVSAGQTFTLEPNPDDKWSGGGTHRKRFCDFRGYPGTNWMAMKWRVGASSGIVSPGAKVVAAEAREIQLFAQDDKPDDNTGAIRVVVKVSR